MVYSRVYTRKLHSSESAPPVCGGYFTITKSPLARDITKVPSQTTEPSPSPGLGACAGLLSPRFPSPRSKVGEKKVHASGYLQRENALQRLVFNHRHPTADQKLKSLMRPTGHLGARLPMRVRQLQGPDPLAPRFCSRSIPLLHVRYPTTSGSPFLAPAPGPVFLSSASSMREPGGK